MTTTDEGGMLAKTYCQDAETGVTIADGKVWFDGCRQCMCQRGVQFCSLVACKKLPPTCAAAAAISANTFYKGQQTNDVTNKSNVCCPTCSSAATNGNSI